MSLVIVDHRNPAVRLSTDMPDVFEEMDDSDLEPFREVAETDDYRQEQWGFRCKCHGWEVQRNGHVTIKRLASASSESGRFD